ncbi:MAG: hypothetical protein ILA06_02045 [Bacteroidaceae bacterium]|nr:hypothetical protein [Bacteroidaceae bacterium]
MKKKVYQRPFMMAQLFEPQSYCSGCGPTETDLGTLYAQCVHTDVVVKVSFINPSGDGYQGQTDGNSGSAGMLYNVGGTDWVFSGPIRENHENKYTNGEFLPAGQNGDTHHVGDYEPTTGMTYCGHTMAAIGQHHHLTNGKMVYINHS